MKHIYFCNKTLSKQLGVNSQRKIEHHNIEINKAKIFIWPEAVDKICISPETYDSLKQTFHIRTVLIVDSITEEAAVIKTTDHINKTGKNYLIGATPYKEKPTFPDVSAVYSKSEGGVFISYGKRFEEVKTKEAGGVQSEWMAVIATVWKYVGVEIVGIGVGNKINSLKNLNNE